MSLATRAAAGYRPTHRLRRWPCFAKRNGGYENDEAWLRQKAPTGGNSAICGVYRNTIGHGDEDGIEMVKKRDGLKPFERILASLFWFQMIELGEKV
jgi:hypothetical protein